jgi:phosphoribosyl-AMP cyclohydrolase
VTVAEEFSITVVETRVWTWTSGEEVGVVVGDFAVSEDEDDDVVTVEVGEVVEGVVCSADDVDVDVEDVEVI